jgi:CheW-like domain
MNAADFVLLRLGPWALALPRRAVRDLMTPQAVEAAVAADGSGATIRYEDRTLPLLVLGDDLQVARSVPTGRRICVLLDAENTLPFALLCDEFEHRIDAGDGMLTLHAVPPAMRAHGSPVKALLQHGDAIAAVTDAQALLASFAPYLGVAEAEGVR